jgi:hypothetical protein
LDRDLSACIKGGWGSGAGGGDCSPEVASAAAPRRRWANLAVRAPSWTRSGPGGRACTLNTSRHSRKQIRARVGAAHGGGGAGSRHRGELARAEGKKEGEGARRDPYHPRVLRRWLEAEDRWCRGRIVAAQGGSAAAHSRLRATARRCEGTGIAGRCSGS